MSVEILTVTQFNTMVNQVLTEMHVWVQGEISGYRVSQGKWVTFDIKDENSKVNCFMTVYQLDQGLEDGMEVKVFGHPRIYVPYGKYSFNVQQVQPVGEGALQRAFELTKQKLIEEGLFDPQHKKEIPRFPEKIGIVTSAEAAAYTDFTRIVENRWGGVEITLRPSLVQGTDAPGQIVKALQWFNQFYPVDVLVLTRGGGSLEDLQAFNSEQVCRAVFASRIPIVCGVGHERDTTLAELAADVRASTPSNAAELVVPDREDILAKLKIHQKNMGEMVLSQAQQLNWQCDEFLRRMEHGMKDYLLTFRRLEQRLQLGFQTYVGKIAQYQQQWQSLMGRLQLSSQASRQRWQDRLNELQKLLKSYNPSGVLKRGYAISRNENGQVIESLKDVQLGSIVQTQVSDGSFAAQVNKII